MLHLYTSRNFKVLVNEYLKITSSLSVPVFTKTPVVVPNKAIGRWLQQQVATSKGISVNLDPVLPAKYAWSLLRKAEEELTEQSDFSSEVMLFSIRKILDDAALNVNFTRLGHYLNNCCDSDRMVLAGKISRIFDLYQVYRGDWLSEWQVGNSLGLGEDEPWQKAMWNLLSDKSEEQFRSQQELALLSAVKERTFPLPKTLCIFGVASLPKSFIELIQALSEHCECYVFAFSALEGNGLLPELVHWHQTGEDFTSLLNASSVNEPTLPKFDTYLHQLQSTLAGTFCQDHQAKTSLSDDSSLLVVNCFSEMREVEALHDFLLNQFAKYPDLHLDDVLVAIPNLDKYAPFIRAVFDVDVHSEKSFRIPYFISGSLAVAESPLINGLLEILEIPSWRFTREQVMVLARNRLIQKRFNFTDDALDQIDSWLDDAGVRWGIDGAHKQSLGLPASDQNTWRVGLDRLLLGAVLPKKVNATVPLFHEVLPVDEIEGALTLLLSQFVVFCDTLFDWHHRLTSAYSVQDWQEILHALLNDFFIIDELEESNHMQLLGCLDELVQQSQQAGFDSDIDVQSLVVLLNNTISSTVDSGRSVGTVNFTSMNNLAGIPFKTLCLLGLNYDAWPTQQREPGFDLLQSQAVGGHRQGDRNRANDERYLTLQLIMSAQESLYVSYVGRNIHNGTDIPPSVLVSELLDCCAQVAIPITVHQHAMHGYSSGNFSTDSELLGHNQKWFEVAAVIGQGDKMVRPLFEKNIDVEQVVHIDWDELSGFYRNPQRHFLLHSLGVYLQDEANDWNNVEPFNLSNFADSRIRSTALQQAIKGVPDTSLGMSQASGELPSGLPGTILQSIEQGTVDELLEGVDPEFLTDTLPAIPVDFHINGINITGVLRDLRPEGQLLLISDQLHDWQKVKVWLQHLILCCVKPEGVSRVTKVISLSDGLVFKEIENPETLLAEWIQAYCDGQAEPLPFFAKLSFIYAQKLEDDENAAKALGAAHSKWVDGYQHPGEVSKPVNAFLYRGHSPLDDAFEALSQRLISPLIKAGKAE